MRVCVLSMLMTMPTMLMTMPHIMEEHETDQVHQQPAHRRAHQLLVAHRGRLAEPLHRLQRHTQPHEHQKHAVHEPRQHLHALVAHRVAVVRRPLRHVRRHQPNHQRAAVEQHVPRIAHQPQRVVHHAYASEPRAARTHHQLHEHEQQVDGEIEEDLARRPRPEDEEEELRWRGRTATYLQQRGAARRLARPLLRHAEEELSHGNHRRTDRHRHARLRLSPQPQPHLRGVEESLEDEGGEQSRVAADLEVRRGGERCLVDEPLGEEAVGHGVEVEGGDDAREAADEQRDERVERERRGRGQRLGEGDGGVEDAGDAVAGGLELVGRAVDVRDAVREEVEEDVEET